MAGENLKAYLGLDTAGFKAGLGEAKSALGSFTSSIAGKLGIGLSIAGLEHLASDLVEYGARVKDLGERFDVSTDSIQKFGNAAEKAGSSMEGVAKGFNRLEISVSKALSGNTKIADAFGHLGVSLEDLRSLSPDELMLKLGKSSLTAADMVAILGKNALELRPLLQGLADGSIELGGAIDRGMINSLKHADDLFTSLGQKMKIWAANALDTLGDAGLILGGGDPEAVKKQEAAAEAKAESVRKARIEAKRAAEEAVADSKRQADVDKEAQRQRERLQFSLKEIAGRPGALSNAQSIQAWWAGQEARNVLGLEGSAQAKAANQDFEGARSDLGQADQTRRGIVGLKESERGMGGVEQRLDTVHADLTAIQQTLDMNE